MRIRRGCVNTSHLLRERMTSHMLSIITLQNPISKIRHRARLLLALPYCSTSGVDVLSDSIGVKTSGQATVATVDAKDVF